MSTAKHTPGPWSVVIDDTGGEFTGWPSIVSSPDLDCSVIHRAGFKQKFWGDLSKRDCIANANLIAAAPDLLDALRECMSEAEDYETRTGKTLVGDWPAKARAAIDKATGGQT